MAGRDLSAELFGSEGGTGRNLSSELFAAQPPVKEAGFSLKDLAASFGIGALGSTKALTDVAGAENVLSTKLGSGVESLQQGMTPERRAEMERQAARMKAAEASGSTFEEIKAGALNVAEAPIQSAAQAIGSFVPYLLSTPVAAGLRLTGASKAVIEAVAKQAPKVIGTAQGAGAVKGSIYEGVLRAEMEAGVDPELAKQKADAAQSYFGDNFEQIALGAGLGLAAGSTGVEKFLTPAGRAGATPGVGRRVAGATIAESLPEAAQGGQERLAENLALQRAGYDVDTFAGVAGAATQEALTGALGAAPIAAMVRPEVKPPESVDAFEKEKEEFRKQFGDTEAVQPTEEAAPKEAAPAEPPTEFPGGYVATPREISRQDVPESYGIFVSGSDAPLTTVASQDEAEKKLQSLTEIRKQEQERLMTEGDKIMKPIEEARRKLEVMEATGKANTDEYVQSKALLSQQEQAADDRFAEIFAEINSYAAPLTIAPMGSRTEVQQEYIVNRGEEPFGVFSSLQQAEAALREREPEVFKQAEEAAVEQQKVARTQDLEKALKPMLAKFNLGDVGLNIVEKLKNNAGGVYLDKLIQVSLDEANPIQTMRHESLHALKDLEFFTPQQWNALKMRAEKQWIKEYLEDQTAELEIDGKPVQMSRLDAYKQIGLTQEEIIEEAIADAFGAYDRGATPPPGMIAALFKKLKNFFMNFGQALSGAGFESSEDIFQRVERGELKSRKPKAEKAAEKLSLPIVRGEETPKFEGPPKEGKTEPTKIKPTVDAIGKYFDDQVKEQNGSQLDYTDKASFDRAVKLASDEVAYQLKKENSGLDWYEDDVKDAFKQTKKLIPELGKVDNRLLFSVMAGIMSPQTTARDNWFIASKAFQHYVDAGVVPGVNPETGGLWQGGTTSVNKKTQLDFLNNMVNDMGQKKALEWLFTDHTVKEINSFRSKYGNIKSGIDGKLTEMRPGLYAFGPKVGPFVSNLNGIHDVTVDKWMTRTFNRYFGTMLGPDGKIVDAPTEPQRRAIKALINEVAKNAGIKPYQAQSLLWFYEQQLFTKIGVISPSYGFSDGAKRFVEAGRGGGEKGVSGAAAPAAEKLSLRKGIIAEVAPNPDHISAEKWREMTPSERLNATKAVANRVVSSVFSELGLKGYKYEFSTGTYEGEVNPNIIVQAPDEATEQELDELGRVLGYVLDQKAMVAFDETNKTSGDQAGFVKVVIPSGMSDVDLNELRQHIAQNVPQADGDTLRDGALLYGNFSAYNDNVDTLTDAQYHKAIRDAIESFPYDGTIDISSPETFHSSFIWPETRSDYLKETRYGEGSRLQGEAGADVRGQGSGRLQAISEEAIGLRDRWIDARGAARLGGRERGNAVDFGQPTAEYGTPTQGSVSAVGVHFSKDRRPTLISEFHGTGLRGLESERLSEKENSDIRGRVYFYVDNGKGVRPESGVGGTPHVIRLNNLYDTKSDPLEIIKNAKGNSSAERASVWERNVKRAGFDGYLVKDQAASQDYAVLIGKHSVKTGKFSLKNVAFPSVKAAKEAVSKTEVPNTQEFKQFIAGNQWTDADGKPKVFYHATAREFFEFTPAGQSQAIFLADTAEEAETFGSIAEDRLRREIYKALTKDEKLDFFQGIIDAQQKKGSITEKQGADFMRQAKRKVPEYGDFGDIEQETYDALLDLSPTRMSIMPLYARAETPFEFENPEHVEQVMQWVANNTSFPQDFPDKWLAGMKGRISQGLWQAIEDKRVQQAIRALGHDSFTVRENRNSPKNYAVYKPEQVKSITGNVGEYSRESKDMRFSLKKVRYSDGRFDKLWNESMYTQSDAENKTKGYLAFVNPMDFVRATASPETFERLLQEQEPLDAERMRTYDQVPFLSVSEKNGDWKITGHEGRHRMLALHEDGYREVPVYIHLRAEGAKSIPVKALTAQYADAMSSVLMAAEVEPLSYANKNKAMEKFTRMGSKVKYSLPNIPTNIDDRIGETTFKRQEKGFAERMVDAISPKSAAHFRQRYLNRYNQMSVYDKKLAEKMGGSVLLADQSAESAALMSDLGAGIAASAMGLGDRNGGIPVLRNGVTTIDTKVKGLIASLAPLAAYGDPAVYQRYQYWAMVKRGQRLNKEGKLTGIDTADVAFAKVLEQKHPEFVSVQKDLIAFNNGLVKYMVDTGVLSKERANEYTKHADYIPFYRQMDGDTTLGPNLFQSLAGVKPPKKLKGKDVAEAPLADFLETMVRNTQSAIQAGVKNYAGQRAINVASQVQAPGMGVVRLNTKENGPDIINVLEKGNLVSYRTPDHLLVDAVGSLNLSELPFMGVLSAPADVLRNLVTKDPGFMMANLMRDSLSAWVTSGQKMTPIAGTVINFGKALTRNSPGFEAMQNAGIIGGYEFSANVEQSGFKLEKDLAAKAGKKDPILLRPFTSVWDALEKGTTASDAATRALIYERVLKDTGNEAEALYRSLEVMNFHRKGNSPLIRVLTAAVPFFNARLQGLDLFYRASTGNMNTKDAAAVQRQFWARGMTMMALSAAYWFMTSDDEEYKKQEQETRDNNWLIPSLGIRIPIPFEVGVLFKVIPERIAAYTFGSDTGKDLRDSLFRNAMSTFAFNPIPQTAKPIIEASFNFNTFTWRPIVSKGMEDVAPEFQVGPSTSNVAKQLGQALGLSPMKVDHIIKGYTGTIGMYGIDTIDMVLDQFGDSPKPTKRFEQLPVIKRFALDAEARGYVTQYYQLKDAVDTTVRTMNLLEKTGESEEYVKYLTENRGTLAFKDYISDTEKTMKDLREMRTAVRSSQMTGDQKRDALLEISKAESAITSQIQLIKRTIASVQ